MGCGGSKDDDKGKKGPPGKGPPPKGGGAGKGPPSEGSNKSTSTKGGSAKPGAGGGGPPGGPTGGPAGGQSAASATGGPGGGVPPGGPSAASASAAPGGGGSMGGGSMGGGMGGASVGNSSLAEKIAATSPGQLVIICFFKPNCEKCAMVNRFYESLVATYPDVIFLDANIARNHEAVNELSIKSVPTFIAFQNHREVGRYEGTNKEAIQGLVTSYNG